MNLKAALLTAVDAANKAGRLMRQNLRSAKVINAEYQHDIKLELDVRCQKLIEKRLFKEFPDISLLGEEGVRGDAKAPARWVVDPIDGTVNFAYGIPHACVSIALQEKCSASDDKAGTTDEFKSVLGVVYDPFTDEMWTAIRGKPAYLNGRQIKVSARRKLAEAILALGFSKSKYIAEQMLPDFLKTVHQVRKIRIMGAAALSLAYVAGGRMDVYLEKGVRLWDIAAGGLLVECAGGEFQSKVIDKENRYWMLASNGHLGKKLMKSLDKK